MKMSKQVQQNMFYINIEKLLVSTCAAKQIIVLRSIVYKKEEIIPVLLWKQHKHVRHRDRKTRQLTPKIWSQAVSLFQSENEKHLMDESVL